MMRSGQHQQTTSVKAQRPKKPQPGTYLAALEKVQQGILASINGCQIAAPKTTSNFSCYALVYQLLFKGLSQDQEREHLS